MDNFTGGTTSWLLCDDRGRYLDDLWFTGIWGRKGRGGDGINGGVFVIGFRGFDAPEAVSPTHGSTPHSLSLSVTHSRIHDNSTADQQQYR